MLRREGKIAQYHLLTEGIRRLRAALPSDDQCIVAEKLPSSHRTLNLHRHSIHNPCSADAFCTYTCTYTTVQCTHKLLMPMWRFAVCQKQTSDHVSQLYWHNGAWWACVTIYSPTKHYDCQAQMNNNLDTSRSTRPSGVICLAKAKIQRESISKQRISSYCPARLEDCLAELLSLRWSKGISTQLPEMWGLGSRKDSDFCSGNNQFQLY